MVCSIRRPSIQFSSAITHSTHSSASKIHLIRVAKLQNLLIKIAPAPDNQSKILMSHKALPATNFPHPSSLHGLLLASDLSSSLPIASMRLALLPATNPLQRKRQQQPAFPPVHRRYPGSGRVLRALAGPGQAAGLLQRLQLQRAAELRMLAGAEPGCAAGERGQARRRQGVRGEQRASSDRRRFRDQDGWGNDRTEGV